MAALKAARAVALSLFALALSAAPNPHGGALAQSAWAGKKLAGAFGCENCHGADGISADPAIPNLAGQKEKFLRKQMTSFRHPEPLRIQGEIVRQRTHPIMTAMAEKLSDKDIADLAAHFSGLVCAKPTRPTPADVPKEVKHCETCHGGKRIDPFRDVPILNSQKEAYLVKQIEAFQRGIEVVEKAQKAAPGDAEDIRYHRLMSEIIEGTAAKIAAYYAALACH
jgi:cytochrome c553